MGIFVSGEMATVGSGSQYLKRDPKGTVVYVLHPDLSSIVSAAKYGCFVASKPPAPFNASWVSIGADDVGGQLGLKAQAKAFLWVLQPKNGKNLSEGFDTLLWEATKSEYETISTQVNEFGNELQGMMVVMSKPTNRWVVQAARPQASKAVKKEVLDAAWAEVVAKGLGSPKEPGFNEAEFGNVVGLKPSVALERKFLIDRSQGKFTTWNEVLRAFGMPAVADGGPAGSAEDVEEYE